MQTKTAGAGLSRKEFLKLGGAGLAGAALLGSARRLWRLSARHLWRLSALQQVSISASC
jgi:hypothetical protein